MEAILSAPRVEATGASVRTDPRHDSRNGPARLRWDGLEELRPTLRRYLARRCRDAGEVDDVVQETILRAARYRGSLAHPNKLQGWALRIAVNVLRDLRRREEPLVGEQGDEVFLEIPDRDPAQTEADEDADLRLGRYLVPRTAALEVLRGVLLGLRSDERHILAAYYGPGGGTELAALQLAIPRELVKVRVFRLRRRVHVMLRRRLALAGDVWVER